MTYKFFILALLFGLSLWPELVASEPRRVKLHFHHNHKLLGDFQIQNSADSLIQKACRGVGIYESDCISTLQSAPEHQKANANELAFFTLRFIESSAANLSEGIKAFSTDPDLPPLLQSAIKDCTDQYIPLDDLVEDAINAVLANAYPDAKQFIQASITNVDQCDEGLKQDQSQEIAEEKPTDDFKAANGFKEINIFVRNMLSAALNILPSN